MPELGTKDVEVLVDEVGRRLTVSHYTTSESEVVDYFSEIPEDERPLQFDTVVRVGVLGLRAVGTTERIDYIEKRFNSLKSDFEERLKEVFDEDGRIARLVERFFGEKGEVPEFIEELFGPEGQIVKELFDPSEKGSPIARLKDEIMEGFVRLRKDMGIHEKEEELVAVTTLKGRSFEDLFEELLSEPVRHFGDVLERTTDTPGLIKGSKKGDFVVTLANRPDLKVAIETKDIGHQSFNVIDQTMEETLENRDAQYGIFAVRHVETLPKGVGWFNEYKGKFLVVALSSEEAEEHLYREMVEIAYRWARTRLLIREAAIAEGIDATAIQRELDNAETVLGKFARIRTQCTNARKAVRAIGEEADRMQEEFKKILTRISGEIASALEG